MYHTQNLAIYNYVYHEFGRNTFEALSTYMLQLCYSLPNISLPIFKFQSPYIYKIMIKNVWRTMSLFVHSNWIFILPFRVKNVSPNLSIALNANVIFVENFHKKGVVWLQERNWSILIQRWTIIRLNSLKRIKIHMSEHGFQQRLFNIPFFLNFNFSIFKTFLFLSFFPSQYTLHILISTFYIILPQPIQFQEKEQVTDNKRRRQRNTKKIKSTQVI